MATQREYVDITGMPEVSRLVIAAQTNRRTIVLRREGKDVATIVPELNEPVSQATNKRRKRSQRFEDSPLWNIVGIASRYEDELDPNRPSDVSTNKKKYLADAYADRHE